MPGQQGSRRDQSAAPQLGGQQPGQGRQDRAVGPVRPGTAHPAAQHHHLMAQHQDLRLLGCPAAAQQGQPAEHPDRDQVQQTDRHEPRACPTPPTTTNRSSGTLRRVLKQYRVYSSQHRQATASLCCLHLSGHTCLPWGPHEQAAVLAAEAEAAAGALTDPDRQADALARVAEALAGAGHHLPLDLDGSFAQSVYTVSGVGGAGQQLGLVEVIGLHGQPGAVRLLHLLAHSVARSVFDRPGRRRRRKVLGKMLLSRAT